MTLCARAFLPGVMVCSVKEIGIENIVRFSYLPFIVYTAVLLLTQIY